MPEPPSPTLQRRAGDPIDPLVCQVTEAYRIGRAIPETGPSVSDRLFLDRLEAQLAERLSEVDRPIVHAAWGRASEGLRLARRGEDAGAARCFAEGCAGLDAASASGAARLLGRSFLAAAEAYLHHRRGDVAQSRALLGEALASDEALEIEHGYEILHIHRVQQLHNLARIELRWGRREEALHLAGRTLAYLWGAADRAPIPGAWSKERVSALPAELVSGMIQQITSELAAALAGELAVVRSGLLAALGSGEGHEEREPRALAWLRARDDLEQGRLPSFLAAAAPLLRAGRGDAPLLWHATAADAAVAALQSGSRAAQDLLGAIARDRIAWSTLPGPLGRRLTAIAGRWNGIWVAP